MAAYMEGSPNLSVTVTNSQAVRRVMMQPPPAPVPVVHREPYPPYASGSSNYTGINRPQRVSSAPIRRLPLGISHQPCGPTNPHRPQSAAMGAINTEVSKNAPYASRMQESSLFMSSSGQRYGGTMPYSSLTDKHLQEYFLKKFMNPRPPSGPRRATSTKAQNNHANLRKKGEVTYKIIVTTGSKKNAGTDAKIYLRINGTKGKLPKQQLKKSGASVKKKKKFQFTKGSTNVFKLTGKDVGELKSIVVENDGLTKEQGWFLEQIEIIKRIPSSGKEKSWVFLCNNWFSLHEGDCQLSRELYAKHSSKTEYEVVVVTGDQKGAGTDSNVSVTIYGKNGNTPKLLLKNNSKNTFERNHTDMFLLKTHCCGPLEKIRIQHDNTGFGPGWFLDRVVVTDLKNPKWKYYFPCGQWLAKDEADGLICRDLLGSRDPLAVRRTNKYKVTVYTGDKRGAGTDAEVLINIFGTLGNSGERKLDNNKNNFERNQVDEFIVEGAPLGQLKRVRIGHDDSGPGAGWFLNKVIVEDMETRKVYEFPCNRWLAKDEDDGQTQRDLMCDVGPQDAPPGIPYTIHVTTSDVTQAGTSARVYLIMYGGKKGEETSGKIWLDGGKFSRGRTDIFNVEVIDALMPLSKIDIGHDNSGAGPGWHLDRVMINCPSAGMEQWFLCNKWLASGEGDGLIERELYEAVSMRKIRKKLSTWHVWVYTSDMRGAGTDANVHLVAYGKTKNGEYKKSDEVVLDNKGDNFESGECDKFKIEMADIGKPYKIRVGHDNSGSFAGWHLDRIEMENMATQKRYTFNCGRWLAEDEDDGEIVRELPAEGDDIKKVQPVIQYQADVYTGKKSGAGTDANVFLNIFGEQGDTGERRLKKSKTNRNKFEKGNVDEFVIDAVNLKALKKIRIGHDGTRAGDGWFLDKVVVRPLDNSEDAVEFECNRWLDVKEDDGLIVRELTAGGAQMLNTTSYHTSVKTGDVLGAGTDANVYVKIFGEKGDTGTLWLKSADNTKNKFEKGRTDLFKLEATDIGKIEKIRIGHDGANPGSGWFLDEVRIDVPSKGENYVFACHRWLDTKEEDGQIEIEMEPTHFQKGAAKIPYEVTVWTADVRGAGTDANVFIQMYGEYGKSETYHLRNRTDNFEQGQMDKFKIEAEDIGPLLKVRVGHDGKGMFAGWFLEKILIQRHLKRGSKRRRKDSIFNRKQSTHQIKRGDAYSDSEDDNSKRQRRSRSMSIGRGRSGYDTEETDDESPRKRGRASSLRSPRDGRSARDVATPYGRRKSKYPDSDEDLDNKRRKSRYNVSRNSDESEEDLKKRRKSKMGMNGIKLYGDRHNDESDDNLKRRRKSKFSHSKYSDESEDEFKYRRKSKFDTKKFDDDSEDERGTARRKSRLKSDAHTERVNDSYGRSGRQSEDYGYRSRLSGMYSRGGRTSHGSLNSNNSNNNKDDNSNNNNNKASDDDSYDRRRRQSQSPAARRKSYFHGSDDETNNRSRSDNNIRMSMFQASGSSTSGGASASRSSMFQASGVLARSHSGSRGNYWNDSEDDEYTGYNSGKKSLAADAKRGSLGSSSRKDRKNYWDSGDEFDKGFGNKRSVVDKRKIFSGSNSTSSRKKYDDDYESDQDNYARKLGVRKSVSGGPFSGGDATKGKKSYWNDSDDDDEKYGRKKPFLGGTKKQLSFRKSYDDDSDKDTRKKPSSSRRESLSPFGRRKSKWDSDEEEDKYSKGLKSSSLKKGTSLNRTYSDDEGEERGKPGPREKTSFNRKFSDDSEDENRGEKKLSSLERRKLYSENLGRRKSHFNSTYSDDEDDDRRRPGLRKKSSFNRTYSDDEDEDKRRPGLKKKSSFNRNYSDDEDDDKRRSGLKKKRSFNRTYSDDEDEDKGRSGLRKKSSFNRTYSDDEDDVKRRQSLRKNNSFYRKFSDDEDDEKHGEKKISSLERRKLYSENLGQRKKSYARPTSAKARRDDSDDDDDSYRKKSPRPSSVKSRSSPNTRGGSDSDESRKGKRRSKYDRDFGDGDDDKRKGRRDSRGSSKDNDEAEVEEYWFVCNRWFAKNEDDGKIVRELLPTTEGGIPLDTGLSEIQYRVKVVTGDIWGAGTDANVFINLYGEFGDTGERHLKDSDNINKFERNQEDIFEVNAIELGILKKLKIRHDNKGGGGAWFLSHVEVEDPKNNEIYFFPCQRWLATDEDDGQIARVLVPADKSLKHKLSEKDSISVRKEIALETKAAMQTYHVYVFTGDKWGAGTDANVYVVLFGDGDDTGQVWLKTSKTNKNKFERKQMDEFVVEAVDIGDLKKIKIGHDNAGGGGAWFLDRVEIDCPALGRKWVFPCGRWLAKGEDDGQLERELYPQDMATEEYMPCIPYEITTHTSDMSNSGTNADVYVVLYGQESCTEKKSLCSSKSERKKCFERGQVDKFVLELEDVGDMIEKIRIGHDGKGWASGWHLDKVEVRRLKDCGKGCEIFTFPCNRWLARDEDDGAIERELVPDKIVTETTRKDGSLKRKEKDNRHGLTVKTYVIDVYTGDVRGAGTDANVFLTIFGDKGDSGERKLYKSETHSNKFERGQVDTFSVEAGDLGKLYKIRIRHDNSMFSPAWFLDKVEVADNFNRDKYTFYSERWLGKGKDDGKIDRTIYVKGYEGDMSSQGTLQSSRRFGGSISSLDSMRSSDPFSKSPRLPRRQLEEIPEGPTIPYTIRVVTGEEKDMGTESNVYIKLMGPKKKQSGKLFLELAQKKRFEPASLETFSVEAVDVKEVQEIEIGHDGVTPGSGWYVKEVEIDMPTKGKHYFFTCKSWLARDRGDGKISRTFTLRDGESSMISYKPMVPYEITLYTGDVKDAGTDAHIFVKVFGAGGSSSDIMLEKHSERFERGRVDLIKLEIEDVAPIKKLRVGHNGKGSRPEWYLEKVELRNMETGDLTVFKAGSWFSTKKGDGKIVRDFVATVKGKDQLKPTTYNILVKTSDVRGAGTDANVYVVLFGENGDSGELHLKESQTNKSTFENNQTDVFTFPHMLSLGTLIKCRVWHDNKGFGAAWHLTHVEVEDSAAKQKYMFPCNRWLSKSDDDKLICRELTCANIPSPGVRDKVTYEIEVITSDKKDAGMIHNAWIILDGDIKSSKEFVMENSSKKQILRRGQTDTFTMVSKNVGHIERCVVGAVEREDKPLRSVEGRDGMWHCHEIVVTNKTTGDKYFFPCKTWISIAQKISRKYSKALDCKKVEESKLSAVKNLGPVKYEVLVVTGDVKHAGTDANVFITIYGTNGDTGKRPLTQKFRNLFERNQIDKFILEVVDLGDLTKVLIEHDNKGFGAGWFLERVEVINQASNRTWTFPCAKWLDKSRGNGAISRELYPRD